MRYFKEFYRFLKHVKASRSLLKVLIKNDFKKQYLGSYFGLIWAFLQPLSFMFVIWFVFESGLRSTSPNGDIPFFLWLISAMIPWFFFASALSSGTNAIVSNSFLVKKVAFRVSILPMVQLGSTLIIHLGLLLFLLCVLVLYGIYPTWYWIQVLYYLFSALVLLLGITWLTSSLRVFVKDITNFVGVLLQMGFWFTPIFWSVDKIPEKYSFIIKLNPAYYITNGYRETFLEQKWFWQTPYEMLQFWLITIAFFIFGAVVFKRLRIHFGDVI